LTSGGKPEEVEALPGVTTVFSPNIGTGLRTGLTSVSAFVAGMPNGLPLNSTVTLFLNLAKHKGPAANFRFTFVKHTENKKPKKVMLIEQLAASTLPAVTGVTTKAGVFNTRGQSFKLAGTWSQEQATQLYQALALLPPSSVTGLAGVTFSRESSGEKGDEGGTYKQDKDTIVIYDIAFEKSAVRYGAASPAIRVIAHEIAHALDRRELEKGYKAYEAAGEGAAAESKLKSITTESGLRYIKKQKTWEDIEKAAAFDTEFRKAAKLDGATVSKGKPAGSITKYGGTSWEENFGEAFSLYITDPATLSSLRPNTYAYFVKKYPR
jgi:hypothetical protein